MTLRRIPGALILGLLASLAGHTALFRGEHAVGGAYHFQLMEVALAAALGFGALLAALAWSQAGSVTEGSVLAARLRERLPSLGGIFGAAAACFVGIEAAEPHHVGAPAMAIAVALAVASFLILRLASAIVDAFARAAIACSRASFAPRAPAWLRRPRGRLIQRQSFLANRRFARPPPVAFAFSRA